MNASALALVALLGGVALAHAATSPRATVQQQGPSVQAMIAAAIAGDHPRVQQIAAQLRAQDRRPRGNRQKARDLNERGLALWQRQRYEEAADYFLQARDADPGDAEIAENLGYALLKSGRTVEAEQPLLDALALAPERASAWGSLGMIYAKRGRHREGVALVLTAYSYARDQKRTAAVYSKLATSDEDPRVRAVLAEVVSKLPRT